MKKMDFLHNHQKCKLLLGRYEGCQKSPLFHFMWVKLLMFGRSPQEDFPKNFQKQALLLILKMIKGIHLVKRSQALLWSNLTRHNQMQILLNNAAFYGRLLLSPVIDNHYSSFFAHAFKTHIKFAHMKWKRAKKFVY